MQNPDLEDGFAGLPTRVAPLDESGVRPAAEACANSGSLDYLSKALKDEAQVKDVLTKVFKDGPILQRLLSRTARHIVGLVQLVPAPIRATVDWLYQVFLNFLKG